MLLLEFVVHNPLHEATLADTGVTDDNELEEMILSRNRLV